MESRELRLSRVGLVRVVAPDGRRHAYGAGHVPPGQFVAELGALEREPGAGRRAVGLTADCRLLLEEPGPDPGVPSLRTRLRWVLAPMRWPRSRHGRGALRLVAWRFLHALSRSGLAPNGRPQPATPVGYLETRPGPRLMPLFEGIHPVTGDQLLTTNAWEVNDLGYTARRLLGYVHDSTPLTGGFEAPPPELPWAYRQGRAVRSERAWPPPCPGAAVDQPQDGWPVTALGNAVTGWAMFPDQEVVRVEITFDGRPVGLARLGLPRADIAGLCGCVEAPICGWSYAVDTAELSTDGRELTIGGTVHGSGGGEIVLPEVRLVVSPAPAAGSVLAPAPAPSPILVARSGTGRGPRRHSGSLKVLAVTHDLGYGGAQLYLAELAGRLAKLGASFTFAAPADGPVRRMLERQGATVHLSPAPVPWSAEAYDGRVAELAAWARDLDFDLVLVNTITSFYGVAVANRLGIPSVIAIHESLDPDRYWREHLLPHDSGVRTRLKHALASASLCVFEAEATRRLFLGAADPDRLLALPYGIDLAGIAEFRRRVDRAEARRAVGIPEDARLVLCLGTIEPRKGQAGLTRAFRLLADSHPDAILALVGQRGDRWDDPYTASLSHYVLRAGLSDRVIHSPLVPQPYEWHAAADVLVCASDNESLPRVILEAMAFETPVVSTGVFGIPEVIEDGVTGYLCRDGDVADLARVLDAVLDPDRGHGAVLAAAAERVRARHDADRYAAAFDRLARRLVEDPAAPAAELAGDASAICA
jgi:D-inositol-3-phosphate glycosyltransferase